MLALTARTNDQWKRRRDLLVASVGDAHEEPPILPVFLGNLAVDDPEAAKRCIAEVLLRHWGCLAPIEVDDGPAGHALGDAVRRLLGVEPYVVVVCGNETQQRASDEFPTRVRAEFGIDGEWLLTDYDRPERVVDKLREIRGRLGDRLVAVVFSQYRNATNVKRDGLRYLRGEGILGVTPDFKSGGSAMGAVKNALERLRSGEAVGDSEGDNTGGVVEDP